MSQADYAPFEASDTSDSLDSNPTSDEHVHLTINNDTKTKVSDTTVDLEEFTCDEREKSLLLLKLGLVGATGFSVGIAMLAVYVIGRSEDHSVEGYFVSSAICIWTTIFGIPFLGSSLIYLLMHTQMSIIKEWAKQPSHPVLYWCKSEYNKKELQCLKEEAEDEKKEVSTTAIGTWMVCTLLLGSLLIAFIQKRQEVIVLSPTGFKLATAFGCIMALVLLFLGMRFFLRFRMGKKSDGSGPFLATGDGFFWNSVHMYKNQSLCDMRVVHRSPGQLLPHLAICTFQESYSFSYIPIPETKLEEAETYVQEMCQIWPNRDVTCWEKDEP